MSTKSFAYFTIQLETMVPEVRQRTMGGQHQVYDPVRKKYVAWQPEEMVRQLLIQYLHTMHKVPFIRMAVERGMIINGRQKRFDLVIFDKKARPWLLAECKSFDVPVNSQTAIQAAIYNTQLQCPYLLLSNGPVSLLCGVDFATGQISYLTEFPELPNG